MSNQLNDALVVLANVITVYYLYALCSGVLGMFTTIYAYFKQREQNKLFAEKLEAMLNDRPKV